jgi:predicted MFS family arabinose efflux permease
VYLSEEVDRRHTAIAAGTYVSGTTVGGLAGRLIAAPIADLADWRWGTFVVALVAAVATAVFFVLAPPPQGFRPHAASVSSVLRSAAKHMRDPRLLVLYGQGFLLMGGFVATYNYLTFRLEAPPFLLPVGIASLLFLAYLAGTVSSRLVSGLVGRFGRGRLLLVSIAIMIAGMLLTLSESLIVIIAGLVVMTAGFFGAHAIASGWSGTRAVRGRSQSTSLYNLWYYAGSSVFGYLGGFVWIAFGWGGVVAMVVALAVLAAIWALFAARGD